MKTNQPEMHSDEESGGDAPPAGAVSLDEGALPGENTRVDLSGYRNQLSWRNKLARLAWVLTWSLLFRPSPRPLHGWRRFLLRCFGAKVGRGAHPYPSAWVWAPWNLEMGEHSCLADGVDCYSVAHVSLGASALVSQRAFLCSATHDHTDPGFPLVAKPITVAAGAWVAAEAFIGPGVVVGDGAVVGARAVVTRDVAPWTVVAGNPARVVGQRSIGEPQKRSLTEKSTKQELSSPNEV